VHLIFYICNNNLVVKTLVCFHIIKTTKKSRQNTLKIYQVKECLTGSTRHDRWILGTLDNINTNLDRLWRLQATCVIPSFEIKRNVERPMEHLLLKHLILGWIHVKRSHYQHFCVILIRKGLAWQDGVVTLDWLLKENNF
jgi:hypothetical protein